MPLFSSKVVPSPLKRVLARNGQEERNLTYLFSQGVSFRARPWLRTNKTRSIIVFVTLQ